MLKDKQLKLIQLNCGEGNGVPYAEKVKVRIK